MSNLLIEKEDLELLRTRNYHLIFCIGPLGSGRKSQIEKISEEFHYSKLYLAETIQKEINSNTQLGQQAKEFLSKNEPISAEILVSILVRGIIECPKNSILIVGFPEKLEHAQYFEQHILPIKLILKFNCPEDICYKRLKEDSGFEKSKEEYNTIYTNTINDLNQLFLFYNPYSIVREIDTNKSITEMNKIIKQNLYPLIYCIIGKRYSGKTELSNVLHEKTGITLLDFGKFLNEPDIIKRKKENEFVVSKLILKLRQMQDIKVLIEDFPQNKEQYTYFVNNCKPFQKIYYLQADNSSCFERVNNIQMEDPNYTDCATLDKMLTEFEAKKSFIDFLKKNSNVQEIDVNNHIVLTIKRMIKQIQPYCVFFNNELDEESKNDLFNKLKTKYNFSEILLSEVIENAIKRKIIDEKQEITLSQKIDLIRPLLFREDCNHMILNSFPTNIEELKEFENKICSINKYIQLTDKKKLASITDENSMAVYFYKNNLLKTLNPKTASFYTIEENLDMTKDINIIYGMPQSGKTTMAKHFKEKYSFELLDFKELIDKVKKSKIDPENPDTEPEVTFPDLKNGLQKYIDNEMKNKRIIIDNFFIPNSPEPFLIDTYEKALEIVKMFGKFRNLYEIDLEEKTLINKYKAKEGIAEELSEDQKAAFNETLEKPKKLLEEIKLISENIIKVKCDEPELKSKQLFDNQYGINFIIIKHEYDICIEKTLQLFCTRNKILYINVPKLIYNHFYENDSDSKLLEGVYGKKELGVSCKNPNNFDELVYYKYNPLFFEKDLINKLILKHIGKNYKIIEDCGNFVLLTGYLNVDLLKNPEGPYNLPLFEIKNSIELGELTAFIQISRKEIKQDEDEKPEEIIIEKPKKEIKKEDGEEGEENQEEEPPEEENPDGVPKFKPENFTWTSYDGNPRNYVQVLKRLKMFPVNVVKTDNCRNDLIKAIKEHLNKYAKKEENKYNGIINIINVGDNIPDETNEVVNDLCKIDVIIEENNEDKDKEKENKEKENKENKENKESKENEKEEDKNNKK